MAAPQLGRDFVRVAKRRWSAFCMADSTGRELTYGRALVGALLVRRWMMRASRDTYIGLLLPGSVGGALANVGVTLAGKVPVNLNFTAGAEAMSHAIRECGISVILTSRAFLAKAGIPERPGMVFLEDVLASAGTPTRALILATARLLPAPLLCALFVTDTPQALLTIIFSSGSTGVPKGVMLSHVNVAANIHSICAAFEFTPHDVMVGVLPFFHSFGYTGTLWLPLVAGFGVVYHPNPTDAKTIGELAAKYRGSILISTPTFSGTYVRKCTPEQFRHVRFAIVGAEKLRPATATAFRDRFGVDLMEGYGCTEMSPVVAANAPERVIDGVVHAGIRAGSVGRPLPGVEAAVYDVESGAGPLINHEGLLRLRGANLMQGYLNEPQRTSEVMVDGWYITGDIARIDEDGFIFITDRLSRFSKIGGEMVPHMKIEDAIAALMSEGHAAVVTAVPDETKGERLVALYTDPAITPQFIWEQVSLTDLPRLWLPKREDIRRVDAIPTLGTGKVDLRAVRQLAASVALSTTQAVGAGPVRA